MWSGSPLGRLVRAAALLAACGPLSGCRTDMQDQPRYESYEKSPFFDDGSAMRPVPEGTVPRGAADSRPLAFSARSRVDPPKQPVAGQPAGDTGPPAKVTRELLDRGQYQFETYCASCHGLGGEGDGMVARRGYRRPPSYHEARLRSAPVEHFVDVMTNGWGAMPRYDYLVPPEDRWAIAAYIRALQVSRAASLDLVPAESRDALASAASGRERPQ